MTNTLAVVIPTYNRKEFLAETLSSFLSETLPAGWKIELIVVDDGGTDGTLDFVRANFPVAHCLRQANSERAVARNHGARFALQKLSANWLLFFDSDDLLVAGSLRAYAERVARLDDDSVVAIYSAIQSWDGRRPLPKVNFATGKPEGDLARRLLRRSLMPLGATLVRATAFTSFDEDRAMIGSEDFHFLFRLGLSGPVAYLARTTVFYRQHATNTDPRKYLLSTETAVRALEDSVFKHWPGRKGRKAYRHLRLNGELSRVGALNQPPFANLALKAMGATLVHHPSSLIEPRVWRLLAGVGRTYVLHLKQTVFPRNK